MEIGEKTTFGSRLKEKRIEKGWSQYKLAARSGCTNSNISYLESNPEQRPKLETIEMLARALDWPVNEARRLAGYWESDDNVTPLEVEDDFRLALHGYKGLTADGRELVKEQVAKIIDFVLRCEQAVNDQAAKAREAGSVDIPQMKLDELDHRIGKKAAGKNKASR